MRRTPQGIRALVRCYCTLVLPIFFGPHYARLRSSLGIVYALFLALVARPRRRRRLGPGSARRPLAACLQGCGSESRLVLMLCSADRGVSAASGNALPAGAPRCGESLVWRACSMAGRDALSQHHQMAHLLPTKCGSAAALLHFPLDGHCCGRHACMRARS